MGVIDLDARVKKLEEGGGGGADPGVIDQLEAAVTDLEETVNGDGDTDLGLVGDMAALETTVGNLIEDCSEMFTNNPLITYGSDPGDPYELLITRIGPYAFMHMKAGIASGSSQQGSYTLLGTLSEGIRPEKQVAAFTIGQSNVICRSNIGTDGAVNCTGGNWFRMEAFWKIATPAPTP